MNIVITTVAVSAVTDAVSDNPSASMVDVSPIAVTNVSSAKREVNIRAKRTTASAMTNQFQAIRYVNINQFQAVRYVNINQSQVVRFVNIIQSQAVRFLNTKIVFQKLWKLLKVQFVQNYAITNS